MAIGRLMVILPGLMRLASAADVGGQPAKVERINYFNPQNR